jgi:hypothetical protein
MTNVKRKQQKETNQKKEQKIHTKLICKKLLMISECYERKC